MLYTSQHYWEMFAVSGILYMLATEFCLPAGMVMSLALGYLFGLWMGTLLMVVAATLGATVIFSAARYLIADWARIRLESNVRARKLLHGFQNNAHSYLLFLRLTPVFPFWLVNLAPAFTPVSSRVYIVHSLLAILFIF